MSDDNFDDFDSLFREQNSQESPLTKQDVERIATNTFVRGYQALQQGALAVQQMTAAALRKTEEAHAGFLKRYQDPEICRKFIEQRPAVARAILTAESGQGTDSLGELYEIFDESARTYEQPSNRESEPAPAKGAASQLTLQQINALPVEERRAPLQSLLERIGDEPIDLADSSPEGRQVVREK